MKIKIFDIEEEDLNFICPICGTNKKGKAMLIPKYNERQRIIQEADVVHFKCFIETCKAKNEFMDVKDFSYYIYKHKKEE